MPSGQLVEESALGGGILDNHAVRRGDAKLLGGQQEHRLRQPRSYRARDVAVGLRAVAELAVRVLHREVLEHEIVRRRAQVQHP